MMRHKEQQKPKNVKTVLSSLGVLCFLIFLPAALFGQESDTSDSSESTGISEDDTENDPPVDTRKLTLLYGIDSEVLSVLSDLRQNSLNSYNELLLSVLADSRNTDIDIGIYGLWSQTKWDGGLEIASQELSKVLEDEDYEEKVVQAAIAYIAVMEYREALSSLGELTDSRETRLAASAVRAVGRLIETDSPESSEIGEILLERLKKEDPVAEDDLVASIIVTLGILEYEPAASELVMILEDEGAPAGHRRLCCISIGQIGRDSDFPIIEGFYFESEDATLRSYALAGLAEFEGKDTSEILIQALKRDSFWRIRLTAAEKLGENQISDAAELLRYKAEFDPVNQVRVESMKALGKIGDNDSRLFLIDYFIDKKKGTDVRLASLSVLTEYQMSGTVDAITEVMNQLWEKDQGRFLEFTCRDLSRVEWDALGPLYERMLSHTNWLLQVYGIRGIRTNNLTELDAKVEALDTDGVDGKVRREVTAGR